MIMKQDGTSWIFVLLAVLVTVSGCEAAQEQNLNDNISSPADASVEQLPIHPVRNLHFFSHILAASGISNGVQVKGVFPKMAVIAKGVGSDSEAGIGALIPWAEKLWAIGYVSHIRGKGLGLYEISEDMTMRRHPASVTGTFANRMVHWESGQAFIGPHAIDPKGNVRTIDALKGHRLTATMRHLKAPKDMVYFLTMEGLFFEVNVKMLEAKQLFNLVKELEFPRGAQPHFKGGFCAQGRVVVANNTYDEAEFLGNGTWKKYKVFVVPAEGYIHHEFPDGFSAHWVRVDKDCKATVYFMYN